VIRIAAMADVHIGAEAVGALRPHLEHLGEQADVLLIGGDLTRVGELAEAMLLIDELRDVPVPIITVLGNHDYNADQADVITAALRDAGIAVLEGDGVCLDINQARIGIAGVKGFGGGFPGATASDFGEPEMRAFVHHTKERAAQLEAALRALDCDRRVALLHYSPVADTLQGEPVGLYPFLGSYLLAEAIDRGGADLALHGHAHRGCERGMTNGGVPVRNVAQPVIGRAYALYCFDGPGDSPPVELPPTAAPVEWRYMAH
jgi:Icc-related predicted phosphoesterase